MGILLIGALSAGAVVLAWRQTRRLPASPDDARAAAARRFESSDPIVRETLGSLSADPRLARWLSNRGLVRAFTVAVQAIAEGQAPHASLPFLAPRQPFRVSQVDGRTVIDPRSYDRYDAEAQAVASLDAEACARGFRQLEPVIEACYRELGQPQGGFRFALGRALTGLLSVPALEGEVAVVPSVHMGVAAASLPESAALVYEFAEPRLEAFSPAQKQLLRMGPRNVRLVQSKLREIARALDLPAPASP